MEGIRFLERGGRKYYYLEVGRFKRVKRVVKDRLRVSMSILVCWKLMRSVLNFLVNVIRE